MRVLSEAEQQEVQGAAADQGGDELNLFVPGLGDEAAVDAARGPATTIPTLEEITTGRLTEELDR